MLTIYIYIYVYDLYTISLNVFTVFTVFTQLKFMPKYYSPPPLIT